MKRLMMGIGTALLLSASVFAEAVKPAAEEPAKDKPTIPAGAQVVDADKLPRCFADKNQDNICDKSVLVGGKCGKKHVKRVPPAEGTPEAEAADDKPAPEPKKLGCTGCGRCLIGKSCLA